MSKRPVETTTTTTKTTSSSDMNAENTPEDSSISMSMSMSESPLTKMAKVEQEQESISPSVGEKSTAVKKNAKTKKSTTANVTADANVDVDSTLPKPPINWDRCHVYIPQKRRFCRGRPVPPSIYYCGNHIQFEQQKQQEASTKDNNNNNIQMKDMANTKKNGRKRIPCPIDPSHYIYEDMVQKHLPICPKAKRQRNQQEQKYYKYNINCGGHGDLLSESQTTTTAELTTTNNNNNSRLEWAEQIALKVLQAHQRIFSSSSTTTTTGSTNNTHLTTKEQLVQLTFQDIHDALPLIDLSKPELDAGMMTKGFDIYKIKSGGARHIPQLASLIGHLRMVQALPKLTSSSSPSSSSSSSTSTSTSNNATLNSNPPETTVGTTTTKTISNNNNNDDNDEQQPVVFLEMGAGRGMFGLTAAGVATAQNKKAHLVMVERAGTRSKADKIFRTAKEVKLPPQNSLYLKLDNVPWSRLVCDLAHVDLSVVMEQEELCGTNKQQQQQQQQEEQHTNKKKKKIVVIAKHLCGAGMDIALKSLEPIKEKIDSCVLATCCHGICTWNEYVGRDYLRKEMMVMEGNDEENNDNNEDDKKVLSSTFGPLEFDLMRKWCAGTVANRHTGGGGSNTNEELSLTAATNDPNNDTTTTTTTTTTTGDEPPEHAAESVSDDKMMTEGTEEEHQHQQQVEEEPSSSSADSTNIPISTVVKSLGLVCGVPGLGRACQRLIDHGRLEYIRNHLFVSGQQQQHEQQQQHLFHVDLHHYVPCDVTPQNAVLVAAKLAR